jgi:hypothetical protein
MTDSLEFKSIALSPSGFSKYLLSHGICRVIVQGGLTSLGAKVMDLQEQSVEMKTAGLRAWLFFRVLSV